jgi:hypothetical protein
MLDKAGIIKAIQPLEAGELWPQKYTNVMSYAQKTNASETVGNFRGPGENPSVCILCKDGMR